jgi:hypothetical protein
MLLDVLNRDFYRYFNSLSDKYHSIYNDIWINDIIDLTEEVINFLYTLIDDIYYFSYVPHDFIELYFMWKLLNEIYKLCPHSYSHYIEYHIENIRPDFNYIFEFKTVNRTNYYRDLFKTCHNNRRLLHFKKCNKKNNM